MCLDMDELDGGTLSVIDAHATLMFQSNELGPISTQFSQAFRRFITVAENYFPKVPDVKGDSPLEQAYLEFWRLYKVEKESQWQEMLSQRRDVWKHIEQLFG